MVKVWQSVIILLGVWSMSASLLSTPAAAQLTPFYYSDTCPDLLSIVADNVFTAIQNESRNAASLLRLHFHDCFVQGCDGSVLLDTINATYPSEQTAIPNINSLRGFGVIDTIKKAVEDACPNVVSCADIVALAAFFSVILSGGPTWSIPLGRRDSLLPAFNLTSNLPPPSLNVTALKANFKIQNLSTTDLVALSGGHTIGLARCVAVTARLYDYLGVSGQADPNINATLLKALEKTCPNGGNGNVTTALDIQTDTVFDNLYYQNLLKDNGVLNSDTQLFIAASDTKALVVSYAANKTKFFEDFATSMIKMGNLNPLTGTKGQIRKNCHVPNKATTLESMIIVKDESPVKKVVDGAEKVAEGAVELFKEVVEKVLHRVAREKFQNLVVEDTIFGEHSSM